MLQLHLVGGLLLVGNTTAKLWKKGAQDVTVVCGGMCQRGLQSGGGSEETVVWGELSQRQRDEARSGARRRGGGGAGLQAEVAAADKMVFPS